MSLSLLLDDANPANWNQWFHSGIFHGITTNPTLLRHADQKCTLENLKCLVEEAKDIGCKEFHIQAWGESANDIANCGFELGKLSTPEMQVNVKVPITRLGSFAAKKLIVSNISVTLTACYEIKQALIASSLGASYLAPYLGRINDQGREALSELISMQKILEGTNSKCKILVASIRSASQINYLASEGIKIFAINTKITEELFSSGLTLKAAQKFEEDIKINS